MRISAALLAVAAAVMLAACGGDDDDSSSFPARHPVPEAQALPAKRIAGIWTGVAKSKDGATYTARMAIDPAGDEGFRGVSAYPGLQCGGNLTGSLERPGVYRFKETDHFQQGNCAGRRIGTSRWTSCARACRSGGGRATARRSASCNERLRLDLRVRVRAGPAPRCGVRNLG